MVVPGVCHVDVAYAALRSHRDVLPVNVLLLHECHALQPMYWAEIQLTEKLVLPPVSPIIQKIC